MAEWHLHTSDICQYVVRPFIVISSFSAIKSNTSLEAVKFFGCCTLFPRMFDYQQRLINYLYDYFPTCFLLYLITTLINCKKVSFFFLIVKYSVDCIPPSPLAPPYLQIFYYSIYFTLTNAFDKPLKRFYYGMLFMKLKLSNSN